MSPDNRPSDRLVRQFAFLIECDRLKEVSGARSIHKVADLRMTPNTRGHFASLRDMSLLGKRWGSFMVGLG